MDVSQDLTDSHCISQLIRFARASLHVTVLTSIIVTNS